MKPFYFHLKISSGNKRAEAEAEAIVEAKAELQLKLGQAPTLRLLKLFQQFQLKSSNAIFG
jgi:hypothetical protein